MLAMIGAFVSAIVGGSAVRILADDRYKPGAAPRAARVPFERIEALEDHAGGAV